VRSVCGRRRKVRELVPRRASLMHLHVVPPSYLSGVVVRSLFSMAEHGGAPSSSPEPDDERRKDVTTDEDDDVRPEDVAADDDDEISVGCPSPRPGSGHSDDLRTQQQQRHLHQRLSGASSDDDPDDDYFKPLKRLKMMQLEHERLQQQQQQHHHQQQQLLPPPPVSTQATAFSLLAAASASRLHQLHQQATSNNKDGVKSFSILDILSHHPARKAPSLLDAGRIVRPWDLGSPPPSSTSSGGRLRRPQSADSSSSIADSEELGDSPAATPSSGTSSGHHQPQQRRQQNAGGKNSSPLDALFQMTSKTFNDFNGTAEAGEYQILIS